MTESACTGGIVSAGTREASCGRAPPARRLGSAAGSACGVVLAALALAACGAEQLVPLRRQARPGGFAGYAWTGRVSSLSASWRVPRIRSGSTEAVAATWIGVEGPGAAFLQIGTNEQRNAERDGARSSYVAFWSDPLHGFHPVRLFDVRAGDEILAALALVAGRWRLSIDDASSGERARLSVAADGSSPASFALWMQENAIDGGSGLRFSYPRLGPTRFERLRVDGEAPRPSELQAQFMSLPGRYLGPTPARRGGFMIARMRASASASAYLRIVDRGEGASEAFLQKLLSWTSSTPRKAIVSSCAALSGVLAEELAALRARRWPERLRSRIAVLARRLRFLRSHVSSVPRAPALLAWRFDFEGERDSIASVDGAIQRALGLPTPKGIVTR